MRQLFKVPICYFPSLVLFLDNGHDFLLNVVLQLNEQIAYRWFDAPIEALDFLESYSQRYETIVRHCVSEYRDIQTSFRFSVDQDLAPLYAELYNPYRFSELSVMVVDSQTRGMDGFDFCRRVSNTTMKKLLLIHADEQEKAQKALDDGLINGFLDKKSPRIAECINREVMRLQRDYFLSMTDTMFHCLNIDKLDCLMQTNFSLLMNEMCARHRIVEYYLIDKKGSFLLLDEDANASIFVVNSSKYTDEYLAEAKRNQASDELMALLQQGQRIPYRFLSMQSTSDDWQDSLIPAARFDEMENFTFSYLPPSLLKVLRDRKILSYHRYLNELDAEELSFL